VRLSAARYAALSAVSGWLLLGDEYGSSENEKQFNYLLKYSPYQNVKPVATYPAVMFFTGDGDTRVDPLHARKMNRAVAISLIQRAPVLLHYSLSGVTLPVSVSSRRLKTTQTNLLFVD